MSSVGPYGAKCLSFTQGVVSGFVYVPQRNKVTVEQVLASGISLYSLDDIRNTPGVYTYIISKQNEARSDYTFTAFPAPSTMELFSKHVVLSSLSGTDKDSILFAGEMKSHGDGLIQYNFLSGSYMKEKMEGHTDKTTEELFTMYNEPMEGILYDHFSFKGELSYDGSFETFITSTVVSVEEIQLLKRVGISAYLVPSKKLCTTLNRIQYKWATVLQQIRSAINFLKRFNEKFASRFETNESMVSYIYEHETIPEYKNKILPELIKEYKLLLTTRDEICTEENDITRLAFQGGKRFKKKRRTRTLHVNKRHTKRRKRAAKL